MSFWSSQKVKEQQNQLNDLIHPYHEKRVQQGAYELALSDQALTTPFDSPEPNPPVNGVLMIKPGQFGLLYTEETVHIPANVIAFISIKASIKFKGLVNVSGFHVDPGYHGRLKFSVYNAGTETVPLGVGKQAFLIWFADLDEATEDPYAPPHGHMNQQGITPDDRVRMGKHVPSPTALEQRLALLEYRWRIFVGTAKYFILPAVVAIIAGVVLWLLTVFLPPRAVHDTLSRIVGHRAGSEVVPPEAMPPEAARSTDRRLRTPIISGGGTPIPNATISPSTAPLP
jgi:dCTP deaminase